MRQGRNAHLEAARAGCQAKRRGLESIARDDLTARVRSVTSESHQHGRAHRRAMGQTSSGA